MAEQTGSTPFPQSLLNGIKCPICQKGFSRSEHLKRHVATHTQEKPYRCQWCQKRFARKDAAQRHQSAHTADESPASRSGESGLLLACTECGQACIKCPGLQLCQRCKTNGLECTYPAQKKRRRVMSDANEHHNPTPSMSPEQAAPEALVPDPEVLLIRSPELPTVANADVFIPASSGPARGVVDGASQPLSRLPARDSLELRADSYPDEALISAIMEAPWTWEVPHGSCAEHVQIGHGNALAGRKYFMPTGDTSLGLIDSDINWLPLDYVSEVYVESIGATAQELPITSPALFSQGSPGRSPASNNQELASALPVLVPPHSSLPASINVEAAKTIGSASQNNEHLTSNEIEGAAASTRTRRLYVDGAGSRSSRAESYQSHKPSSTSSTFSPDTPSASFHEVLDDQVRQIRRKKSIQVLITHQTYEEIIAKVQNLLSLFSTTLHSFSSESLPSIETLDWFVRLYFENFNPVYPFLDRSLLSVPSWGCCITLATAAVGANYMTSPEGPACSDALHGLLYEILTREYELHGTEESLVYVQARALNAIGLCGSRHKRLMELGYKSIDVVSAACSRLGLLDEIPHTNQSQSDDLEHAWITWRVRESRRRTGLFIWMLDCILAYTSNSSPHFSRSSLKLRLPSSEDAWDASTSHVWQTTMKKFPESEPFQKVLQILYVERRLAMQMSEFATMILIHGLIYRTWDVAKSFEDSLSLWTPSAAANQQPSLDSELTHKYLPSIPEFSRWRNSACDCLDVLHWEALGPSAKMGGLEGPTFLKLHLARLVLLTPVKELEGLMNALSCRSRPSQLPHNRSPFHQSYDECYKLVRIWVERDKYKARLAVVHASATFWHVRRYSSSAFVQPFAVFLATVVLWAYSAHSQRRKHGESDHTEFFENERPHVLATADGADQGQAIESTSDVPQSAHAHAQSRSRSSNPGIPDFMHLDRPFDDEIGQRFIRDGDQMRAFMEGVGDLCSESGPQLVLREGARLLRNQCGPWAVAENYAKVLEAAASNFQAKTL